MGLGSVLFRWECHALLADVSIDLIIEVREPSRGEWMSGSGGMGIIGVVSAIVRGWVGHVFGGAGEEWRCRQSVVVTKWYCPNHARLESRL